MVERFREQWSSIVGANCVRPAVDGNEGDNGNYSGNFSKGACHAPLRWDELRDRLDASDREVRKRANAIINNLTICDPAVGSGYFLISALNELIAVKSELGILSYRDNGDKIKEYRILVENDELIVTDKDDDALFAYELIRST